MIESRSVEDGTAIRRRRECDSCGKRFTTYERTKGSALWVIKKDGTREPFEKDKLRRGILRAIEKRPVSIDQVDKIIDQVEREMLRKDREEVKSNIIGSAVVRRLKKVDKVAWMRFASVYLEFENLSDFKKAMKS